MIGESYFIAQNALKRLFFVTGLTSDEFYTDGGLKVNIEQLIHLELKRNGYERIVFYDEDNKLYCYDEDSLRFLRVNGKKNLAEIDFEKPILIRNRGLKRGEDIRCISEKSKGDFSSQNERSFSEKNKEKENLEWQEGEKSGVLLKNYGKEILHLGVRDNISVKRQIDGYMYDSSIKTAVIINDPTFFLKKFGSIIFFVGLTLPRYRFSKPSASLDMNLRHCVG